jgi:hypothetical protein
LDFGNDLEFWQRFGILATIWNFGNDLEFWQRFGILATIWDFGNGLEFEIWDLEFWQNAETIFRHMSNPKPISAYIGFGTQV